MQVHVFIQFIVNLLELWLFPFGRVLSPIFLLSKSVFYYFRPKRVIGWTEEQEFELRNLYDRFCKTDGEIFCLLNDAGVINLH